jgi:hypothetical protein
MTHRPRRLRKLLALDGRGWRDLFAAQAALLRAEWRLRREPIGSFVARDGSAPLEPSGDPVRARELARAVERAANHGIFRPFCLVRAIAIRDLLERHDIVGSTIRIGVRRHDGAFNAHAWVRWGPEVLGDRRSHVATFTEVDDIRVLGRS